MKNVISFSILIIVVASSCASAGVGIIGGVHFSNWYGSDYAEDLDRVSSTMLGASFDIEAGEVPGGVISVNPEILYVVRGWKHVDYLPAYLPPGYEYTTEISMDYLEIPLLFKYTYDTGTGFSPFVTAGGYIAFMLDSPDMERTSDIEMIEGEGLITAECFESSDFGLVLGGGVTYSYSIVSLSVEARYSLGLSSVVADGSVCAMVDPAFLKNNKNRGYSLLAGISF